MTATKDTFTKDEFDAALKDAVSDALSEFKTKMDALDKDRKAAIARAEKLERSAAEEEAKRKDEEAERLKADGKALEALELKLSEQNKVIEQLRNANVSLTRDAQLKSYLAVLPFKNARALDMAYRDIVGELEEKDGQWLHKSGTTLQAYVGGFAASPDQAFLFKQPPTSGSRASGDPSTGGAEGSVPLSKLPQTELLRLAAEGKLPNQR